MPSIRSISRIEPAQLALITGIIYGVLGIIVFCLMFLSVSMIPMPMMGGWSRMAGGIWMLVMPVLYAVFGYLSGFIGALVYNLVAKAVGGIKVTVSD